MESGLAEALRERACFLERRGDSGDSSCVDGAVVDTDDAVSAVDVVVVVVVVAKVDIAVEEDDEESVSVTGVAGLSVGELEFCAAAAA